jgi:hypothetical protein
LKGLLEKFKPTRIQTAFFTMEVVDLGAAIVRELEAIIQEVTVHFPPDPSTRFLPSSLGSEFAYYVHVLEFLDGMGITRDEKMISENADKLVLLWNAVGSFYFETNIDRSTKAY